MKVAQIQFTPWDKSYNFNALDFALAKGDKVIVKTELGVEIGEVKDISQISNDEPGKIKPVIRPASREDLEKIPDQKEQQQALAYCRQLADKFNLSMKMVGCHFSFDGSRLTFAFIADGRVDFRELVKELTRHFNRTIRLQQIGIRDEARLCGDYGHCGRRLCCGGFLRDLNSITSDMAEVQQCAHRGSERLSGVCGRLMCCLAYEAKGYQELAEKLPALGARVSVDGQRGVIVGQHVLKQSVDVEFSADNGNGEGKTVAEVDLNRKKNK